MRQTTIYRTAILFAYFLLTLLYIQDIKAQQPFFTPGMPTPKHEVRAVWLTTIGGLDWPHSYSRSESTAGRQKKELTDILDKLKNAGINTVLLQTRVRATTIYGSAIEPWDGCMSGIPGRSPGYDPLAFAIDECHKRGMELHAWVVTIPVGKWNATGCASLRRRYPRMVRKIGDEGYMNPESPMTADYLARICAEITGRYDIDGIHLDYIRYPETWPIRIGREQARRNITGIVRKIHRAVKSLKPWVKMSCSPIGKHDNLARYDSYGWNAYTKVCQDAQGWLKEGLMDELFPMMYFRGNQFYPFAIDWAENSNGRIVVPGLGIYFMHRREKDWPLETVTREMEVTRQLGMGHAFFRSKFFTDNVKGIYSFTADRFNTFPALIPPMTWEGKPQPSSPTSLQVEENDKVVSISWSGAKDNSGAPYLLYNAYASETYPVDVSDARNLIATRLLQPELTLKESRNLNYAVTACDRYGNESIPLQLLKHTSAGRKPMLFIDNDGKTLTLPDKGKELDADYVLIESLTGCIVATRPYTRTADIGALPEGMYELRSVNKKGVQHRIGRFAIRRSR